MSAAVPYLKVRVTPSARQDAILGWQGSVLRIRVRAPPERGRANEAACALLAGALGLPAASVAVTRGATSREKLLLIEGLSEHEVLSRLGGPMV